MSDDLMFQDAVRDLVRTAYGAITTGAGRAMARRFYSDEELASLPAEAVDWALGVGNPVRRASLSAGDVVLDLGCGAGIDTVLAARRVGPTGRVIGLDMLAEMCDRARGVVRQAGVADRCDVREGEMEAIPLPDESVDVVISNGVVNLSPRKSRVFAETARVLRPGGRFCVSDLVVDDDLPPEVQSSQAAWAGCIAGALSERVFARKLDRAGLADIEIDERSALTLDDIAVYPLFTPDVLALMGRLLSDDAKQHIATSVIARARKPATRERRGGAGGTAALPAVRSLDGIDPDIRSAGLAVRRLKRVEDVELKVMDIEAGHTTPLHAHSHGHEGIVISGVGVLELAGQRVSLTSGDVFTIAPNEPQRMGSGRSEALRLVCLDCFVD
jgi:arsenite methyltransferase